MKHQLTITKNKLRLKNDEKMMKLASKHVGKDVYNRVRK